MSVVVEEAVWPDKVGRDDVLSRCRRALWRSVTKAEQGEVRATEEVEEAS
ncbi:hypothetical protein ABZ807_12180 [Micromonospora sp. NPDC047548]